MLIRTFLIWTMLGGLLAADQYVGAGGIQVEDLHPIRHGYPGVASDEGAVQQPARTRGGAEEVALAIDDAYAGGIPRSASGRRALGVRPVARGGFGPAL